MGLHSVQQGKTRVREAYSAGDDEQLEELWEEATSYQDEYFDHVAEHGLYGMDGAFAQFLMEDPQTLLEQIGMAQAFTELDYSPYT